LAVKKVRLVLALVALVLVFSTPVHSAKDTIQPDCTYKGFKLYGKFKIVESFPDIKVKIVDSFPDLKVKHVEHFPDKCGKWKMVESFPEVKIKLVDSFPDIKIKFVDSFPGLP
jgi:CRISPR/Cas system CSM-associated protein Csm4 (group 5 of RAMP superfamily)